MSGSLTFDLRVRFDGFSLEAAADVPASGITVLSGPSGSGKSTLLRAIAGLEPHAVGTVHLGDDDWSRRRSDARSVGYVFQDARLFPHLDVAGNLAYGARRRGTSPETVEAVIDALDLGPLLHRTIAHLSGGEARRVALGRALASGPRVLLMDEPLSGLDRARKADLMPYIARAIAGFGGPALYVTHSAYEVGVLADRILGLSDGRLTGWSGPAPRLKVQVLKVEGDQIEVGIGTQQIWVRGHAEPGASLVLPLGTDCLISANPPGRSTGAATLEARAVRLAKSDMTIDVAGQHLVWPLGPQYAGDWTEGQVVWLTLPRTAGPLLTMVDSL